MQSQFLNNRCFTCQGSGKLMGGGMMYKNCEKCDGCGVVEADEVSRENKIKDKKPTKYPKDLATEFKKIEAVDLKITQQKNR